MPATRPAHPEVTVTAIALGPTDLPIEDDELAILCSADWRNAGNRNAARRMVMIVAVAR